MTEAEESDRKMKAKLRELKYVLRRKPITLNARIDLDGKAVTEAMSARMFAVKRLPETTIPRWAVLPAAFKLLLQCLRHPNTSKEIYVDQQARKVRVVSYR